jgi:hypothetical protein
LLKNKGLKAVLPPRGGLRHIISLFQVNIQFSLIVEIMQGGYKKGVGRVPISLPTPNGIVYFGQPTSVD